MPSRALLLAAAAALAAAQTNVQFNGFATGSVSEASETQDSFTVELQQDPGGAGTVTLKITSTDAAAPTFVSGNPVSFNSGNWNSPQQVVIKANDDNKVDGAVVFTVEVDTLGGSVAGWGTVNHPLSSATFDDDVVGVTTAIKAGEPAFTTEAGGTQIFVMKLSAQPTANVVVTAAVTPTSNLPAAVAAGAAATRTEATVEGDAGTLIRTFTGGGTNWDTGEEFTLTGVADDLDDGDGDVVVTFTVVNTGDVFDGVGVSPYRTVNQDADTRSITVSPNSDPVLTLIDPDGSAGATQQYTITLGTEPQGEVTVALTNDNDAEGVITATSSGSTTQLIFKPGNPAGRAHTITVQAVDEDIFDPGSTWSISYAFSGTDIDAGTGASATLAGGYKGFSLAPSNFANTNQDTKGIEHEFTSNNLLVPAAPIVEGGAAELYRLKLVSQPIAAVTVQVLPKQGAGFADTSVEVSLEVDRDGAGTFIASDMLIFSTDASGGTRAWDAYQTVRVTPVDDDIVDGNIAVRLGLDFTGDLEYVGHVPAAFGEVTVNDNAGSVGEEVLGVDVRLKTSTGSAPSTTNHIDVAEASTTSDMIFFKLTSQPTSQVVYSVSVQQSTGPVRNEYSVDKTALTFQPNQWNVDQSVIVTAVDDDFDDGGAGNSVQTTVLLDNSVSTDAAYNNQFPTTVTINIADDDAAAFTVTAPATPIVITEAAGASHTATYRLKLASEPTAPVFITVASDTATQGTAYVGNSAVTQVRFDNTNWNDDQEITVEAVDDLIQDDASAVGFQSPFKVQHTCVSSDASTPNAYCSAGVSAADIDFKATDDDVASIIVSPASFSAAAVNEGDVRTFEVKLATEPSAGVAVQIPVQSSDTARCTVDKTSLSFNSGNWQTLVTVSVSAVQEEMDDGEQDCGAVLGAAVATGDAYNGKDPADLSGAVNGLKIADDDESGVVIAWAAGASRPTEGAGEAEVNVKLATKPGFAVTVDFALSDATEAALSTTRLVFSTTDWPTNKVLTITGSDDGIDEGTTPPAYTIETTTSSTGGMASEASETSYDSMSDARCPDITLFADGNALYTEDDADAAGFVLTAITGKTDEGQTQQFFTVKLTSDLETTQDVQITAATSDSSEGIIIAPATLTFTDATGANPWNVAQSVTVEGVNDLIEDDDVAYSVTLSVNSADAVYSATTAGPVIVTNSDDADTAAITVNTATLTVTEAAGAGHTAEFEVNLASEPIVDIVFTYTIPDTNQATSNEPLNFTFTNTNWMTPRTFTVTAVDDNFHEASATQTLTYDVASVGGGDAKYDALATGGITLTMTDDDPVGFVINPPGTMQTTEDTTVAGNTVEFTVKLTSQPTADVVLTTATSNSAEATVGTVTFFAAVTDDWKTLKNVVVTGQDDWVADIDQPYTISFTGSTSTDTDYQIVGVHQASSPYSLVNVNNDSAAFTFTPVPGAAEMVNEDGSTPRTISVVLTSQPTATVVVNYALTGADPGEGQVDVASVSFTNAAGDWAVPRVVTVTGRNDDLDDGDQSFSVTASVTTTDTSGYGSAAVAGPWPYTNEDDDVSDVTFSAVTASTSEALLNTVAVDVKLTCEPLGDVTITFAGVDTTESSVVTSTPLTLTFKASNWKNNQPVSITGVNDDVDDDDVSYNLTTAIASAADATYAGLTLPSIEVTNADDDTAGVIITPASAGSVSEAGTTAATYQVKLATEPVSDVVLTFTSNDTTEGSLATNPTQLTFKAAAAPLWNTFQAVVVTAAHDDVDDGDIAFLVGAAVASADSKYSALTVPNLNFTNVDNDTAAILVSAISGATSEAGATATWTVRLGSEPTGDVLISAATNDTTEGQLVNGSSIAFGAGNWSTPQTLTVQGQDDAIEDDNVPYSVISTVVTADAKYAALSVNDFDVTNNDDADAAGYIVSAPNSTQTSEMGGAVFYTVKLNSEPVSEVTIDVATNVLEGSVSPSTLVFGASNWSTAATVVVTGVDDFFDDGNVAYTVAHTRNTADSKYAALTPSNVALSNVDDDTAGVTLASTSLTVNESGTTALIVVSVDSQPRADVAFTLTVTDASEIAISNASITFDRTIYPNMLTVTVTGLDDDIDDDTVSANVTFSTAASTDLDYSGKVIGPVMVTIDDDDDTAGFLLSATAVSTAETLTEATYTVKLTSEPVAPVTIAVGSVDATEATKSVSSVTFAAAQWNTSMTVTLTGVDDSLDDGDISMTIAHDAESNDSKYNASSVPSVVLTNVDDDVSSVTVSQISGNLTEAGASATFDVVLTSEPFATVTVDVASFDMTEGTVDASLEFTAGNWNAVQQVTVMPMDDFVDDGDVQFRIRTFPVVSLDGNYSGFDPTDVSAFTLDNDEAGLTISETGLVVSEAGAQQLISLVLDAEPLAAVTLPFSSSDVTEAVVLPSQLVFQPADWNVTQTLTVVGQNDFIDDGNVQFKVNMGPTQSTDPLYNAKSDSVDFTCNDDADTAGVVVSVVSGAVDETGTTATFTMALTSEPLADVVAPVSSSDTDEVTVNVNSLLFTPANWNVPQVVTATGVNDDFADGPQEAAVSLGALMSTDVSYNNMAVTPPVVTNNDDDAVGVNIAVSTVNTSETGASAMVEISLKARPLSPVTMGLSSSDLTEGAIDATAVTFAPASWNVVQSVKVTGQNDDVDDGDVKYNVVTAPFTSDDAAFAGVNPQDFELTNLDDDSAGVSISQATGTLTELGGTASFSAVLSSQPLADVRVTFSSLDPTEARLTRDVLVFSSQNWNIPQAVVAQGVADTVVDGDQSVQTRFATTSTDLKYAGLAGSGPLLVNLDASATGTLPPTPVSTNVVDNRIKWCLKDSQCFGTGSRCDTTVHRCVCGPGLKHPVVSGVTEFHCIPQGDVAQVKFFDASFSMAWSLGNCAAIKANNNRLLSRLLVILRDYFQQLDSFTITCGSVHVSSSARFTSLDAVLKLQNSAPGIQSRTQADAELNAALGTNLLTEAIVLPETELACAVANAQKTVPFSINGRTVCSALVCNTGFVKTTGFQSEQICTPVGNPTDPNDPTSVSIPCVLSSDCTGFAGQVCSSSTNRCIVGTATLSPLTPRGTPAPADDDDDTGDLLKILLPVVFGVLLCCLLLVLLWVCMSRKDEDADDEADKSRAVSEGAGSHAGKSSPGYYDSRAYAPEGSTVFEQSEPDAEFARDILV
eukprot:TRINITY_DN7861_c0_g4_i1.p1 TRINITY_DN7861_c0_g4~~TRINITY_DN7861_c0_g4_i1.p1  ORF type:complete len:3166 (+),score=728.41 TRINITY_DN7861_c0_g4_i1:103-9600(+)